MLRSLSIFVLLVQMLLAAGCGVFKDAGDPTKDWSAQKFYQEAKDEMDGGNFDKAIKLFEQLEARYPYGQYAEQAQIEIAYVYYKQGESASSVAAADRFIKLHPNHPNVDYAYYLKGLANFHGETGLLGAIVEVDLSDRDPKSARESFEAFKELVTRFPDSKYAPDATLRMNYLVNALALHEVYVARYYLKRGAPLAVANRAQYVLKTYPQAPATEEALYLMVKAYESLGMSDLRDDAARVLQKNFPNSKFLSGINPREKSWWKFW